MSRADSGVYGCLATNPVGHSIAFLELRVQEPPDRPVELRALEVASRTVTLSWALAYGGNAPITSYVVQYRDHQHHQKTTASTMDILEELLMSGGGTSENDIANAGGGGGGGEDRGGSSAPSATSSSSSSSSSASSNTGNYYHHQCSDLFWDTVSFGIFFLF